MSEIVARVFGRPDGWQVVNPSEDKDTLRVVDDDTLELQALPGSTWGRESWRRDEAGFEHWRNARNVVTIGTTPRAEQAQAQMPGERFVAEVRVRNAPSVYGEQGGLFLWCNFDQYVKLVKEGMRDGSTCVVLALEAQGQPRVVGKQMVTSAEVLVRLTWTLDGHCDRGPCTASVEASFAAVDEDGSVGTSVDVASCQLPLRSSGPAGEDVGTECGGDGLKLALVAHSAPPGSEARVRFAGLRLRSERA